MVNFMKIISKNQLVITGSKGLMITLLMVVSGCASLKETVNGPSLTPMNYPQSLVPTQPEVLTAPERSAPASSNSLWRTGARAFFNDQRARQVGDILTVVVAIDDAAQTQNATSGSRTSDYDAATPNILGLESTLGKILPGAYDPSRAFGTTSSANQSGSGTIKRSEQINLTIAAVVTGILPNGNLILQGTQEVRTNREVRILSVSGIARPEDITATNTIKHDQLAEARIHYGGKGDITNMNTPPASQALMQKYSPF
jgi:flagellar L-ring protein precursor FlgH